MHYKTKKDYHNLCLNTYIEWYISKFNLNKYVYLDPLYIMSIIWNTESVNICCLLLWIRIFNLNITIIISILKVNDFIIFE